MQSNSVCYHTRDKQTGLTLRCRPTWVISLMITDRIGLHLVPLPLLRSAVCSNGKPTSTDFGKKWDGKNGKCNWVMASWKNLFDYDHFARVTQRLKTVQWETKFPDNFLLKALESVRSRARRNFSIVSSACLTVIISWLLFHRRVHSTPFTNI